MECEIEYMSEADLEKRYFKVESPKIQPIDIPEEIDEKNPYNFSFDGAPHLNRAFEPAVRKYVRWRYRAETIGTILGCSSQMVNRAIEEWGIKREAKKEVKENGN